MNFVSLKDGIIITQILSNVLFLHSNNIVFDISRMNINSLENWTFCLSNLKILINSIEIFFINFLNLSFNRNFVDINLIARKENRQEIKKLCQLFITILVLNENNKTYIEKITLMEQKEQNILMELEQEIIHNSGFSSNSTSVYIQETEYNNYIKNINDFVERSENENKILNSKNEILNNLIQELTNKLNEADKQIEKLNVENEKLKSSIEKQTELINQRDAKLNDALNSNISNLLKKNENSFDEYKEQTLIKIIHEKNLLQDEKATLQKIIEEQIEEIRTLSIREEMKNRDIINSNDYITKLKERIGEYEALELKHKNCLNEIEHLKAMLKDKEEEKCSSITAFKGLNEELIKIREVCLQNENDLSILREENIKLKKESKDTENQFLFFKEQLKEQNLEHLEAKPCESASTKFLDSNEAKNQAENREKLNLISEELNLMKKENDLNSIKVDQENGIFSLKPQSSKINENEEMKLFLENKIALNSEKISIENENIEKSNEYNRLKSEINKVSEENENLYLKIQELLKEKSENEKNILKQNELNLRLNSIINNNKKELENLQKENQKLNDINISMIKKTKSRCETGISKQFKEKIAHQKATINNFKVESSR